MPRGLFRACRRALSIFAACVARAVASAALVAAPAAAQAGSHAPVTGGFCSPPTLGAPCAVGTTTTPGTREPMPGFELGNPVHLANGNKYQLDIDLPPNPSAPGLELVRHYNGLATLSTSLGRNWSLSYDARLLRHHDGWHVRHGDGSITKIPPPIPQGTGFLWQWPGGRGLHFDAQGMLSRIRLGATTLIQIHRHPGPDRLAGLIDRVEAGAGHTLRFHYADHSSHVVVESVDTPAGRFHYSYGTPSPESGHRTPRLESVERPDGMQRLYHYEPVFQSGNPYALTGISLRAANSAPQRLSTWKYERYGRVVELQQHGRALPILHIEYLQTAREGRNGLTRVHASNGLKQDIRYERIAGQYRLLYRGAAQSAANRYQAVSRYDPAGRLTALGGLKLERGPAGELLGLTPDEPGWPGLAFQHRRHEGRHTWQSQSTGITTIQADAQGRPSQLEYANGDHVKLRHDALGRPVHVEEAAGGRSGHTVTTLQWRGPRLIRIEHPAETEFRRHNASGRVTQRTLRRPAMLGSPPASFREAFQYDAQGRLRQHGLPEGGVLHYAWHDGPSGRTRLASLHWEDTEGRIRPVVTSERDMPGYRYGNGLELASHANSGPHADTLALRHGDDLWWLQQRSHDAAGRILRDQHAYPPFAHYDDQRYTYDTRSRLQGALHLLPQGRRPSWYAWYDDGRQAASRTSADTRRALIHRDGAGLPVRAGAYGLRYGPGRRLQEVSDSDTAGTLGQYRHNAFGHRIVKHAAGVSTHYLYLNGRLVAEARSSDATQAPTVTRRYLHAGLTPVGMIEYPTAGPPRLYAVHADLSGAPRLITDADRQLRWLASYTPMGKAERVAGDLDFSLRLPGQYEDKETGWHDNLLRTYDPESGHYLEPDPLGPVPGTDTYGYANQQPWRYADPDGLLLFAFDGTRYSAETMGNVWKLAQAYREGATHYHSGPGNSQFLDWDAVVAWRAGRILENQWQALLTAVEHHPPGTALPINIIGFSRGAALARHFGNQLVAHVQDGRFSVDDPMRGRLSACVDLRFMGLFDTVAQFGVAGSHDHMYDFAVSEMWSWVSHAVALHEHRWTFPLTSADAGAASNVVEAPFVGAHADIGGGLALHHPPSDDEPGPDAERHPVDGRGQADSDLARIALAWMHWQAQAASVGFVALPASDTRVQGPALRDMRSPLLRTIQQGDRAVLAPSGAVRTSYQDSDSRLGRETRAQVESFIQRIEDWRSQAGEIVGTVDMNGYSRWLEDTLGWSPQAAGIRD